MNSKKLALFTAILIFYSCQEKESTINQYGYGTHSDSAVYFFNKGWEYIMDYGQWTSSEEAFRKAIEFDPNFLIGKSLVGKITQDLNERKRILVEVEKQKSKETEDDQLLLEITLATLKLMNARDEKTRLKPEFYESFYHLGETNYRKFIHKHPEESYMKAEYIEFLHRQYGAQRALDSLNALTTPFQKNLPFFIGYSALLTSEMGNHKKALETAAHLKDRINDPSTPQPYVTYAQVYADMDSLKVAKTYVDKAVQLDPNHVIAQRLKNHIDSQLE